MQFTGYPGYEFKVRLETSGIDMSIPSNKEYYEELSEEGWTGKTIDFELDIDLRICEPGEQFTSTGKCDECDSENSYTLTYQSEPGSCITCPTLVAICVGGDKIGPKPGYWRKNNSTDNFIQCFNEDACLGMVGNESPTGECAEGYNGYLCANCDFGYSKTASTGEGAFKCAPCPNAILNII